MLKRPNEEIRQQLRDTGLYQYDVADEIGINEITFIRWLRKPLDSDRLEIVQKAIDRLISKEKTND